MPVYFPGNGLPAGQKPVGYILEPDGSRAFDESTKAAIIEVVGDATQSLSGTITTGYTVQITGTAEILVCAGPCSIDELVHSGTPGAALTIRDAGTAGTGVTAAATIDLGTTPQIQLGVYTAQYGVTAQLSGGSCTLLVRAAA